MPDAPLQLRASQPGSRDDVDNIDLAAIETSARVLAFDVDTDVAIVALDAPLGVAVGIRSAPLAITEHVSTVGHSGLQLYSYTEGFVSGHRLMDLTDSGHRVPWVQTTAIVMRGHSGGGLFDDAGNLVGICSRASSGFSFWAPTSSLLALARAYGG
jgi:S1-C subfamily serine protease